MSKKTDRIWIKGRRAWHATTVEAIDKARAEDRMVAVTCDELIAVHDTITISTERPETGCCGGCMVRIERVVIEPSTFDPLAPVNLAPVKSSAVHIQRIGRSLRRHKSADPIDVIHSRNPELLA